MATERCEAAGCAAPAVAQVTSASALHEPLRVWTCEEHRLIFVQQAVATFLLDLLEKEQEVAALSSTLGALPSDDVEARRQLLRLLTALDRLSEAVKKVADHVDEFPGPEAREAAARASEHHDALEERVRSLLDALGLGD